MRVIAGTAKRLQLKTLDGMETRPTTDRIKETLFNMIAPSVFRKRFSGLVCRKWRNWHRGIEQRRQRWLFLSKKNPKAMACVKEKFKLIQSF